MASLTGQLVAETYKALLKVIDNDVLTASEKQITDGFGGGSNVFIDSNGFLRANKYKVTNGLATQFLKADGSLDSNTYLTGITSSQIIAALGYTPVTNARTLTINGTTYDLSANRSWTIEGSAAVWGNISGTLSNQTDLQTALNAKFNNPTGTISQYIRGDGSLATFPTITGLLPTGGTAGQILAKIDATYYNAEWIDNYATQTKNEVKLGATLAKGTPVYVSSANGTNMIVSASSNTTEATSSKTFGLLETGGVTNDLVKCVTFGLIAGLDTSMATAGDPVWLGPSGTLLFGLANKPVAPAHMVYIGVVTRVQSNNGEIFVNVQNGFELDELHDVLITNKQNNQGLFYESSTGLWKNKTIATVLGYTPQAQLNGTGFVKASGTTITYDNSTYLTTADAASTYQLLTNLSTDLTASATKYPSVNAVIAGLDGKLNLTGGTLTGNLTISNANPKLFLTDTDNNPDYSIQNSNGTFKISDETNSADRLLIYSTGIGYYNGDFKANKLYVDGGTSSQFIKGDGTLDTNTYLTAASLDGYLAKSGGTMTGDLNFYTLKTTRVGGYAYIRGSWQGTYWGIGAAATGHTIIIDQVDFSTGAYESITDVNLMLGTRTVLHSGNYSSYALPITGGTVSGSITATSFVKSGGLSTQFLMADGSVSTYTNPVTGTGSATYIPKWTSASNLGSSNISDDGTSIGIAYTTPNKGGYGRTLTGAAFGSASFGFEAVGGTTTNGGLVGGLSFILSQNDSSRIVGSAIQSNLVGTTATNYGADLRFYAKADAGVIGEVVRMTSAGLRVYGTIIKDGGTASQFLKADGSVDSSTYVQTSRTLTINGTAYDLSADRSWTISTGISGSGTTNYIPKWTSSSALGNSIILEGTNAIGIGNSNPQNLLHVGSAAGGGSWMSGIFTEGIGVAISGTKQVVYLYASSSIYGLNAYDYTLGAYNDVTIGWGTSATNVILSRDGGKVGIGITSFGSYAANSLVVYTNKTGNGGISIDNALASGSATTSLFLYNAASLKMRFDYNRADDTGIIGSVTSIPLTFWTNNSEKMRLSHLGYLGINSSPQFRLHVIDNQSSWASAFTNSNGSEDVSVYNAHGGGYGIAIDSTSNDAKYIFKAMAGTGGAGKGSVPVIYAMSNGKVGIGTSSPSYGLDIQGSSSVLAYLNITKTGYSSAFIQPYNDGVYMGSFNNYPVYLRTNNSTIMTLTTDGSIGIGNTNPTRAGGQIVTEIYASYYATLRLNGAGSVQGEITGNSPSGWLWIGSTSNHPLILATNSVEKVRLTTGGNFLVSATNSLDPVFKFQVGEGSSDTRALFRPNNPYAIGVANGGSSFWYLGINAQTASNGFQFYSNQGGVAMTLTTGNLVGLAGNTSPEYRIDLCPYNAETPTDIIRLGVNNGPSGGGGTALGTGILWKAYYSGYTRRSAGIMQIAENNYFRAGIGFFTNNNGDTTSDWSERLRIYSAGNATFFSYVTATAFYESSDIRLKTLIDNSAQVNGIENLEAKLYEKDGKIELGYFAQDAEKLMPYAVTKGMDGFLNLSYREVHTAKIARLEKRVAELEKQLNIA